MNGVGERPAFYLTTGFGARVRALRRAAGLSQKTLAAAIGCSVAYLSLIERGRARPSVDRLPRLATALGVSVSELHALGRYPLPSARVTSPRPLLPPPAFPPTPPPSGPMAPPPPRMAHAGRYVALGQHLRMQRIRAGLVPGDVALRTGVSRAHLVAIEMGRARPGPALLQRIASVLDIDADDLARLAGYRRESVA